MRYSISRHLDVLNPDRGFSKENEGDENGDEHQNRTQRQIGNMLEERCDFVPVSRDPKGSALS